jgi:hypothetical protein
MNVMVVGAGVSTCVIDGRGVGALGLIIEDVEGVEGDSDS